MLRSETARACGNCRSHWQIQETREGRSKTIPTEKAVSRLEESGRTLADDRAFCVIQTKPEVGDSPHVSKRRILRSHLPVRVCASCWRATGPTPQGLAPPPLSR